MTNVFADEEILGRINSLRDRMTDSDLTKGELLAERFKNGYEGYLELEAVLKSDC